MSRTWVLVAESSRAKLYSAKGRKTPLNEVEAFVHPATRLHEGDLVSDRAGSDGGSVGQGRHVVDNKMTAKGHESIVFAKELAKRLDSARNNGEFRQLILVAPPTFLGVLREQLDQEVMQQVTGQIDKNLVQQSPENVLKHLSEIL